MEIMMTRHQWHQLKALTWDEWFWLFVCYCLLVLVASLLRVLGYGRTKKLIHRFIPKRTTPGVPNEAEMVWATSIARLIRVATWHGPLRFNCLTQALVLWGILTRRGVSAEIRFGLHNEPGASLFAHAWVECRGINLMDNPETQQKISAFV